MPDNSPASRNRAAGARSLADPQVRGLTQAQLSAAERVMQRERSRSRVMVRLATSAVASGAKRPA